MALESRIRDETLLRSFAQLETCTAVRLLEIIKDVKRDSDYRDKQLTYRALDGSNAFHLIIKRNIPCEVDSLLQLGKQAISQCTLPSEAATSKYNKFIRKIFMAQDNIDIGNTPLHYALSKDQIDIKLFKIITKHCPSAWQVASHDKISPFNMAEKNLKAGIFVFLHKVRLIKENTELIKKVLANFPIVVSVPDIDGNTPIHRAAMAPEVLSLFLDAAYAGESNSA